MAERKTKDVLKDDQILHPYQGRVQKVYIVGEVKHYENDSNDKKVYVQEFFGSYVKPKEDGTFDKTKRGLFRAETTEPFADLTKYADNGGMLLVTGQTFRMNVKTKEGKELQQNKTFCRSIKEAVPVVDKDSGRTVFKGGDSVMSKDIAVKTDYWKASNVRATGYINFSNLNKELKNNDGEVFAYGQMLYLSQGKDSKSLKVEFNTAEKVDAEKFAKGERLSMIGAMRLIDYQSKKENKMVSEYIFEPALVCEFIDKKKDKDEPAETKEAKEAEDVSDELAYDDDDDIDAEAEQFAFGFNDGFDDR